MPYKTDKGNIPQEMLRWSLSKAGREFGVGEGNLAQRLAQAGELAGPDECYATSQILRSLYGDIYFARLRKTLEEADERALKNSLLRGEFLPRAELLELLTETAEALKQIVRSSKLDRASQDDFLRTVSSIPVQVRNVAAAASVNGKNGKPVARRGWKRKSSGVAESAGTP